MQHPTSVFDIVGPIMVGPSSSHTAGAIKLGQMARAIFDKTPNKVTFILHGSFGTVYKGHATDRALLAGIMKFRTSDPKMKNAFEIARKKGIKYKFEVGDLGIGYHPNSVKIILEAKGHKKMTIIGSSIGGGEVEIRQINEFDVEIRGAAGRYFTLLIGHKNTQGIIASLTGRVAEKGVKIAGMQSTRLSEGGQSLTILNLDSALTLRDVLELEKIKDVQFVRTLHKVV